MSLYVIGDTHLALGTPEKTMEIFGGWEEYATRLEKNWNKLINPEDVVVIAGDISWALKLEEGYEDLKFLHGLKGKKILLKGNHDLWWSTKNKVDNYLKQEGFDSIEILFNNTIPYEEYNLCGTRGWMLMEDGVKEQDHKKITQREIGRLELSLKGGNPEKETIVFFHYPPIYQDLVIEEFFDLLEKYKVKQCYYGHIHGKGCQGAYQGKYRGVSIKLISADYVKFCPYFIL